MTQSVPEAFHVPAIKILYSLRKLSICIVETCKDLIKTFGKAAYFKEKIWCGVSWKVGGISLRYLVAPSPTPSHCLPFIVTIPDCVMSHRHPWQWLTAATLPSWSRVVNLSGWRRGVVEIWGWGCARRGRRLTHYVTNKTHYCLGPAFLAPASFPFVLSGHMCI